MEYKSLELKRNLDMKQFSWNGKEIKIKKYLPIEAKYDIVMITIQEAYEEGIYNPIRLDMHFHLNLVYMYSNLEFTEEERQDPSKLYDEMKGAGFLDEFLKHLNPDEYKEMLEYIEEIIRDKQKYNTSMTSIINKFIEDLPQNAEAARQIVDNFNPEKYQAVVDFAKAANGNRQI